MWNVLSVHHRLTRWRSGHGGIILRLRRPLRHWRPLRLLLILRMLLLFLLLIPTCHVIMKHSSAGIKGNAYAVRAWSPIDVVRRRRCDETIPAWARTRSSRLRRLRTRAAGTSMCSDSGMAKLAWRPGQSLTLLPRIHRTRASLRNMTRPPAVGTANGPPLSRQRLSVLGNYLLHDISTRGAGWLWRHKRRCRWIRRTGSRDRRVHSNYEFRRVAVIAIL